MRTPKRLTKKQQLAQAKVDGFKLGLRCGAVVATTLVRDGWKDLRKLPNEVFHRITGEKWRHSMGRTQTS
jgi:hypothetical protein